MIIVKKFKGYDVPEGASNYNFNAYKRFYKWTDGTVQYCEAGSSIWKFSTIKGMDGLYDLPQEPEQYTEENDWLKVGGRVITPNGEAEIYNITEDSGVITSRGNYCRTELSQVPEQYMPKVGDECEWKIGCLCRKGTYVGINSRGSYVVEIDGEYKGYHKHQIEFRPIKTEREKVIEWARKEWFGFSGTRESFDGYLFDIGALKIPDSDS